MDAGKLWALSADFWQLSLYRLCLVTIHSIASAGELWISSSVELRRSHTVIAVAVSEFF